MRPVARFDSSLASFTRCASPPERVVAYFESDPEGNGPKQQFRLSDDPAAYKEFIGLTRDPYFNPRA